MTTIHSVDGKAASLQLLTAYLLSTIIGIPIPAKYTVTESIT